MTKNPMSEFKMNIIRLGENHCQSLNLGFMIFRIVIKFTLK